MPTNPTPGQPANWFAHLNSLFNTAGSSLSTHATGVGTQVGQSISRGVLGVFGPSGVFHREFDHALSMGLRSTLGVTIAGALSPVAVSIASFTNVLSRAKSVLDMAQSSGMGLLAASQVTTQARAFGVPAESLQGMGQNAFLQRMVGGAYGISGPLGSEERLQSFRDRYREMAGQGDFGLMMAESLAKALKMEGFIPAANLSDGQFNKQLERARGLELNPELVERVGQQFKGLLDTVGLLGDRIKTSIAAAFLPLAERSLEALIRYWETNQKRIIDVLFNVGRFLYVDFPPLVLKGLAFLAQGASGLLHGLANFTRDIVQPLMGFLGQALSTAKDWLSSAAALLQRTGLMPVPTGATGVGAPGDGRGEPVRNSADDTLRKASEAVRKAGDYIENPTAQPRYEPSFGNEEAGLFSPLLKQFERLAGGYLLKRAGKRGMGIFPHSWKPVPVTVLGPRSARPAGTPLLNSAGKLGGGVLKAARNGRAVGLGGAIGFGGAYALNGLPQGDISAVLRAGMGSGATAGGDSWMGRIASGADTAGNWFDDWGKKLGEMQKDAERDADGRRREYDVLRRIADSSEKTAASTDKTAQNTLTAQQWERVFQSLTARTLAYIVEDTSLNLLRV